MRKTKWLTNATGGPAAASLTATLVAAALLLPGACAPAATGSRTAADGPATEADASGPAAQPIDRELALLTFDSAWSRIRHTYYDSTFRGLDWDGIGARLRPEAGSAATLGALRDVIGRMLAELGESHFALIPQESADALDAGAAADRRPEADIGVELHWVEGSLAVLRVDSGGAADAGVRAGWVVESIDGRDVSAWRERLAAADSGAARTALLTSTLAAAERLMRGPTGSAIPLRLRDGADRPVELTIRRRPIRGELVRFGNLPPLFAWVESREAPLPGDACAGVIRLNVWMVPVSRQIDRAVDDHAHCDGIVFDLRGNPGGVGGMVMGVAGSFFAERVPLGIQQSRAGEIRYVAMPRALSADGTLRDGPYTGRLAVLVDERSMSTSEIFAAGMQATGRARLFGAPTPGFALPALMLRLPTGDVLYHAIANLTDPGGRRIEGAGVQPDVRVQPTRAQLLAGRDPALEAALAWIGEAHTDAGSRDTN